MPPEFLEGWRSGLAEQPDVIRLAEAADGVAVCGVVEAAYLPYVASIGAGPGPLDDDIDLIRQQQVWLVEQGGDVCAILVLCHEAEAMLLSNVAVNSPSRARVMAVA